MLSSNVVTLNLQDCSSSNNNNINMTSALKSPTNAAPLVKINLSPENTRRSELSSTSTSASSLTSPKIINNYNTSNIIMSMMTCSQKLSSPSSSTTPTISTANQATINTANSPGSSVSSLIGQASAGKAASIMSPLLPTSVCRTVQTPQKQYNQQLQNSSSSQLSPQGKSATRIGSGCGGSSATAPPSLAMVVIGSASALTNSVNVRKASENSMDRSREELQSQLSSTIASSQCVSATAAAASNSAAMQQLQRKLEQQARENLEIRDKLLREKTKTQMVISENLLIKEELKKIQVKLKEYENLHSMRTPKQQSNLYSQHQQSPQQQQQHTFYTSSMQAQSSQQQQNTFALRFSNLRRASCKQQTNSQLPNSMFVLPSTASQISVAETVKNNQNEVAAPEESYNDSQMNFNENQIIQHESDQLSSITILDILDNLSSSNNNNNYCENSTTGQSVPIPKIPCVNELVVSSQNQKQQALQQQRRRSNFTPKSMQRINQKKSFY